MIKRWGKFLVLGVIVGAIYLIYNNYHTLWDMILNIPVDLIVSYLLGGLTMYWVIFGKLLHRKKRKNFNQQEEPRS